jgi:hypothetical protein
MPDEAAKKRSSSLIYDDERETLQLRWSPPTQDMDDDATKQTLELLATEGDWLRSTLMLVDAAEFFRDFGEAALAWRNENVAPRYNGAGATRFAFLVRRASSARSRPAGSLLQTVPPPCQQGGSRHGSGPTGV